MPYPYTHSPTLRPAYARVSGGEIPGHGGLANLLSGYLCSCRILSAFLSFELNNRHCPRGAYTGTLAALHPKLKGWYMFMSSERRTYWESRLDALSDSSLVSILPFIGIMADSQEASASGMSGFFRDLERVLLEVVFVRFAGTADSDC